MSEKRPSTIDYEQHEIIYRHWYITDKGERHLVEEPIGVSYSVVLGTHEWGARPYLVNEMIDKIKSMLLNRMASDDVTVHWQKNDELEGEKGNDNW